MFWKWFEDMIDTSAEGNFPGSGKRSMVIWRRVKRYSLEALGINW